MIQSRLAKRVVMLAGLTAVYFVAGKLGLRLAFVHASVTAVWAPTGIALAAVLLLGARIWPALMAGAFLVNVTTAGTVGTSIGIALGNTFEGLLGASLIARYAAGPHAFERARTVFLYAGLATLSTTVSATFGVTSLALGGVAPWTSYGAIWLTWWLGDAGGALVVAPVLLLWTANARVHWVGGLRQALEATALVAALVVTGLLVFGGLFPSTVKTYPLEILCIPVFLWAAFRFGQRESATALLLLAAIATWGTLQGFGPFARGRPNESLLLLQTFLGVVSLTTLVLAAVVDERRRVEAGLRDLAVTDPLTGLANYRRLMTIIESEIERSGRTARPFAVLLLDLDDLKVVNDRHGHLVGSRALCRLADVLRLSCRAIDTAARFGGDEFALVLPETDEAAAGQVAARIRERLKQDGERPRISASMGVAVFPRDGETVEAILSVADQALYEMKGRRLKPRITPAGRKRSEPR